MGGQIGLQEWYAGMQQETKILHMAEAALARGGFEQMRPQDWRRVEQIVAAQWNGVEGSFPGLRSFAEDIHVGRYGNDVLSSGVLSRAGQYGDSGRLTYENERLASRMETERREAKRELGALDHCEDCTRWAGLGWIDAEEMLTKYPIGASRCGARCWCVIVTRRAQVQAQNISVSERPNAHQPTRDERLSSNISAGGGSGGGGGNNRPPSLNEESEPERKPVMTYREAERWAAKSAYPKPIFHTTISENLNSIYQHGLTVERRTGFGRVYGDGLYLSVDEAGTAYWRERIGTEAVTVEARTNIDRFVTWDIGTDSFETVISRITQGREKFDRAVADLIEAGARQGPASAEALRTVFMHEGFNAILITDKTVSFPTGGSQLIVFDPERVVVINGSDR